MNEPIPSTVRFRFTKLGKIRFTSQRDVARMWERALRRTGLPVAWSGGFSPRPLLSFGLALPTGCESLAEYLDVRLEGDAPDPPRQGLETGPELARTLSDALPNGLVVTACAALEAGRDSLQQEVTSCNWEVEVFGLTAGELAKRVQRLLDAPSVVIQRERKGRRVQDDLRPAVRSLALVGEAESGAPGAPAASRLAANLATQPRGVRPRELLEGLGAELVLARACRTHQWIEREGVRWEPLDVSGHLPPPGAPANERAS